MIIFIYRMTIFWLFLSMASFIGLLAACFRPFKASNIHLTGILFRQVRYLLNLRFEIINQHYIENLSPSIFISNHQSGLDVLTLATLLPKNTVALGKRSILVIPIFGQLFYLGGCILINRKNKRAAIKSMNDVGKTLVEKKISLWIMPEGTRSGRRGLLPFKKGAFHTAINAQIPIIPVAISSYYPHVDLRKWKTGTIYIKILKPIETTGMIPSDATRLCEQARIEILKAITHLDNKHNPITS